jgi:hypothetical protein
MSRCLLSPSISVHTFPTSPSSRKPAVYSFLAAREDYEIRYTEKIKFYNLFKRLELEFTLSCIKQYQAACKSQP